MTGADHLQGFPKIYKARQTDGHSRNSQRTVRGEGCWWEQLRTYLVYLVNLVNLVKSRRLVSPPLCAFFPGRLGPREVFRAWMVIIIIFFQSWRCWLAFLCLPVRILSRKRQLVSSEMSVRILA